jgi:TRAP-type C4-dicarboxylate transport system permease small subunit
LFIKRLILRKNKFLACLLNADLVIAGVMLALLIGFTFMAVIMRYVVSRPITWGEEFQLFCIVFIVFFGAGAGFRLHNHVAIDIVVDLFPKKAQKVTGAVIYVLTVIVLAYFCVHSAGYVKQMFKTERVTNLLHIPYFLIYGSFPLSCVLMIINYSLDTFAGKSKEAA